MFLLRLFGRRFLLTTFIVYLLLPMVLVVVGSFGKKWFGTMFPEGFTWGWYRELFSNTIFTRALRMSFFIATLVVIANMAIGIPAVYAIYVSRKEYLKKLFDNFVMLPIAISPLVIGMGLIQVYNWPSFSLIGTWEILLFAHCVFTIPFMVKPVMANLEMINWRELDEASESLGASGWYKARRVFLPNLLPGIVAGSVMSFSISLGEFPLAVLLSGSTTQTYPVALYQAFYFPVGFACAATSLLLLAALFALLGMMFLMKFTHMRQEDFAL